jgi:cyclase
VQDRIYLIGGAGSNIAVQVSNEGTVLVDTGESAAADKGIAEIKKLQIRPVRWIINTNADLNHTGGREAGGEIPEMIRTNMGAIRVA